jgi:predicted tellurium resistance membrane protein TerC
MFEWMADPQAWLALLTLTALEIVLGIDNIIFISILTGKLPPHQREKGRIIGLSLAMITRILLLLSLAFVMRLTKPLITMFALEISGRDLILIGGGLFLLGKSTLEIHDSLEGEESHPDGKVWAGFAGVMVQVMIIDIVFSLDSVITALGMANHLPVMVLAVVIAVIFMMFASGTVSRFVEEHPTVKMLALSFLLIIGLALVADGFGMHIPKGYIYFAMAFSVFVEALNIKLSKKKTPPVHLRKQFEPETEPEQ